jgi:hypothetical protein
MSVPLADERRAELLPALREDESIMDTLKGRVPARSSGSRLTVRHLEQRDRALAALERAQEEIARLVQLEDGSGVLSPRIGRVREVAGEVGKLRHHLDATYV